MPLYNSSAFVGSEHDIAVLFVFLSCTFSARRLFWLLTSSFQLTKDMLTVSITKPTVILIWCRFKIMFLNPVVWGIKLERVAEEGKVNPTSKYVRTWKNNAPQ